MPHIGGGGIDIGIGIGTGMDLGHRHADGEPYIILPANGVG